MNNEGTRQAVFVAGGAGYIGSHTCKALYDAGYLPITLDNLSSGHEWAVKWGPLEILELTDHSRLKTLFAQYQPLGVFMFSGYIAAGESVTSPLKYWQNNLSSLMSLVQATIDAGVDNFIFSSTAAVYAQSNEPLHEQSQISPMNPYGKTKLASEEILRDCEAAQKLKAVCLRYFNAAGAGVEDGLGEAHDPETHLIPLAIRSVLQGSNFHIYGQDYSTPDGTCVRDYIHVRDLARAHVAALTYLLEGGQERVFNLGTSNGYSVLEIIQGIERISGIPFSVVYGDKRAGDPDVLVANSRRAQTVLKWTPIESDLDNIISSAFEWEKIRGDMSLS